MPSPFLTAQWRKLLLVNYAVDKQHLVPLVPYGTELETYNEICYVSLVGFMFEDVKIKGIPVPFHSEFEEINLRFYVKHVTKNGASRSGVVFIREFAPKIMLEIVANSMYHEHYETLRMQHNIINHDNEIEVAYKVFKDRWYSMKVVADTNSVELPYACEEEFITEHSWGYTTVNKYETNEYEVWHPRWRMYPIKSFELDFDFAHLYGEQFSFLQSSKPFSVMLAEGSEIKLWQGEKIG